MMEERLADLDELILRCRNEQARKYIAEAVACYRAAAFRSSIVATWIAIVFDFIQKLHELELSGDANAKNKLAEFERIVREQDIKKALEFERTALDEARDTYELISPSEHADLKRLLEDRNRCAHPSMNSFDKAVEPHDAIIERGVELYAASTSFADANSLGARVISPLVPFLKPAHVERVFAMTMSNSQIRDSKYSPVVLRSIRDDWKGTPEVFDELFTRYGLHAGHPHLLNSAAQTEVVES